MLQAIEVARRTGHRADARGEGERLLPRARGPARGRQPASSTSARCGTRRRCALLGGARALLYPVQSGEPFGLVLAEAAACGTPVAALRRGAVSELVDDVTGEAFDSLDALVAGLPRVLALDRAAVRARAVERFGIPRMVDALPDALPAAWPRITGRGRDRRQPTRRRSIAARRLCPSRRRIAGVPEDCSPGARRGEPLCRCCAPAAAVSVSSTIRPAWRWA